MPEDKGVNGISVRSTTVIIVVHRKRMEKWNSDDLRNKKKTGKRKMKKRIEAICQVKFAVKVIRYHARRVMLLAYFTTLKRDLIEYLVSYVDIQS